MRYISPYDNLVLYDKGGREVHKFVQGKLVVGDPTLGTSGNIIDAAVQTDDTETIQRIYAKDLSDGTTNLIELIGQGALDGLDSAGAALSPFEKGYRGTFFEAPIVTPTITTDLSTAKRWEVLQGTVTYAGTVYKKGEIIDYDGTNANPTAVSSAKIAMYLPYDLLAACSPFRAEEFKKKYLGDGTEAIGYWDWQTGYTARNSGTTSDEAFIGYVKS